MRLQRSSAGNNGTQGLARQWLQALTLGGAGLAVGPADSWARLRRLLHDQPCLARRLTDCQCPRAVPVHPRSPGSA